MAQVYVNGRAYDSSLVQVKLAGMSKPFAGFKGVTYKENEEMEQNYGIGQYTTSYGLGNITVDSTLSISSEEFRNLVDSSPNGRLQSRPLEDLVITFAHPEAGKIVTDVVRNVKIKNSGYDIAQNDKEFVIELELMASHIDFGQR